MTNAASWSGETASVVADDRTSAIKRSLALGIVVLVATVSISTSLYLYGKQTLQQHAKQVELRGGLGASEANFEMLRRVDRLAFSVTSIAIVGGVGCLIPLFFASVNWRRRVHGQLQQKTEELQTTLTRGTGQTKSRRKSTDAKTAGT
jgi:hypothetical protein